MTELSKKVITFGCRLNNLESELIDQQLKQHSIDKNTFIFNTCAVTSEAERKARQQCLGIVSAASVSIQIDKQPNYQTNKPPQVAVSPFELLLAPKSDGKEGRR